MNDFKLWEGLYQSILELYSMKRFKWYLLNIQFLAHLNVQHNFPNA